MYLYLKEYTVRKRSGDVWKYKLFFAWLKILNKVQSEPLSPYIWINQFDFFVCVCIFLSMVALLKL